jgi:hypothetical protein
MVAISVSNPEHASGAAERSRAIRWLFSGTVFEGHADRVGELLCSRDRDLGCEPVHISS